MILGTIDVGLCVLNADKSRELGAGLDGGAEGLLHTLLSEHIFRVKKLLEVLSSQAHDLICDSHTLCPHMPVTGVIRSVNIRMVSSAKVCLWQKPIKMRTLGYFVSN